MNPFHFNLRLMSSRMGAGPRHDYGTTVPTDASTGYPTGSLFVKTDGSGNTCLYVNEGSVSSCDFNPMYSTANSLTIATGKTLAVTDADALTINSVKSHPAKILTVPVAASGAGRGDFVFVADRAYTVSSISERHNVVSTGAATLSIRKILAAATLADAAAGATVVELLASALDLQATAGTTQAAALSAVGGALSLAAGDAIGVKTSADTSGLVGCNLTIALNPA